MHVLLVKAVPAGSLRALPVPIQILLALIVKDVVLTRHKEDIFGAGCLEQLIYRVKLFGFREMADVASVQYESWWDWQGIDLVHRGLQCTHNVRIRCLVEPHVAITDLDEAKFSLGCMFPELGKATQAVRTEHPAFDHAKGARPRPRHALQEAAAINSVMVVVV